MSRKRYCPQSQDNTCVSINYPAIVVFDLLINDASMCIVPTNKPTSLLGMKNGCKKTTEQRVTGAIFHDEKILQTFPRYPRRHQLCMLPVLQSAVRQALQRASGKSIPQRVTA